MRYPIASETEQHEGQTVYGVVVPDLPGCVTVGDTVEEAYENIIEAIELHLQGMADDGDDIPMASSISKYLNDPEYAGMTWALVSVDVSRYLGKTQKVNITLPSRLVHMIDEKVASNKERYHSRSSYLATLAEKDLLMG